MANNTPPDGFEDHPPDGYEGQSEESFIGNLNANAGRISSAITNIARGAINIPSDIYQTGKQILDDQPIGKTPIAQDIRTAGNVVLNALPHLVSDPQAGGNWRLNPGAMYNQLVDISANPIDQTYKNPIDTAMAVLPFAKAGGSVALGLAKEAAPAIGEGAIKGASAYFGPSEEAIKARLANPSMGEISSEDLIPQTAQKLSTHMNNLQTNLNAIEDKVWGSLLKLKAEPKSTLLGMVNNIKGQIKVTGTGEVASDADQMALDAMDRLSDRIKNMKTNSQAGANLMLGEGKGTEQFFDQNQLRQILQSARKDVNWADPGLTPKNEALVNFSHYLSEYLKGENPQYANQIQQSAERSALLDNAERTFSLDKVKGQYSPTNTTANKIQALLNPNNIQSQQVADQVKNLTGFDVNEAANQIKYTKEFEKTATQGSRRAVIGKAIGGAVGGVGGHSLGGAAMGAMAGGYLDKYAAQNLGNILDYLNKLGLNKK